jgi:TonB family protein
MILRIIVVAGLLAAILLSGASRVEAQEKYADFTTLASDAVAAIDKYDKDSHQKSKVRVFDFEGEKFPRTALGHELSGQFADSLRRQAQRFVVLTSEEFQREIAKQNIPSEAFTSALALRCYMSELGDAMLVDGEMQSSSDGIVLTITVWSTKKRQNIFSNAALVPMTAVLEEVATQPAPPTVSLDSVSGKGTVWVNPQRSPLPDDKAEDLGKDKINAGYVQVKCIRCPNPSFTQNAVDGKVQGTVLLQAQILSDGSITKLSVTQGVVCGLTDKAIAAVAHWTFKPATRPDGTPIAVTIPIEVSFRLY